MAILRHETPDGAAHFDLLLAETPQVDDEARAVPTWRCDRDPFTLRPGERARIERIDLHRGLYLRLDHVCTLSGARGSVRPVRRGWHQAIDDTIRQLCSDSGSCVLARFEGDSLEVIEAIDQVNAS
jgi:hypothetical protein